MKVVSPLLKRVVYPGLSRMGYLRSRNGAGPIVLTYHGVLPEGYQPIGSHLDGNLVTADQFRDQLRFLKTHYQIISPDDFRDHCQGKRSLPARAVLITCDDGLKNNVTAMLPILWGEHLKCLFFVTQVAQPGQEAMLWHEQLHLQLLGANNQVAITLPEIGAFHATRKVALRSSWPVLVERLSMFGREERENLIGEISRQLGHYGLPYSADSGWYERFWTLNQNEVRQLADAGMAIGAHTDSHPKLSRLSTELAKREMAENRSQLETILGREVWALAYPFGDAGSVSRRELALAEQCGFTCAFMNSEISPAAAQSRFALPRVHLTADTSLPELEARISGFHSSLKTALHGLQAKFA
ncbi:MAG TPA: polysaccharide deacetylase family protein [Terriglobales bacterium]